MYASTTPRGGDGAIDGFYHDIRDGAISHNGCGHAQTRLAGSGLVVCTLPLLYVLGLSRPQGWWNGWSLARPEGHSGQW